MCLILVVPDAPKSLKGTTIWGGNEKQEAIRIIRIIT